MPDGSASNPPGVAPAEPVAVAADADLDATVEAVLLCAGRAVQAGRVAEAAGLSRETGAGRVEAAIARLNRAYDETGRSFRIERVAGGWRLLTRSEHADAVAEFLNLGASSRLSRAAVETLAIIAYRQPVTRAELESIRGVACGEVLRSLLERRLIEIAGRAEEVGRPMRYGTTRAFLEMFGLASLKDLPAVAPGPGGGAG